MAQRTRSVQDAIAESSPAPSIPSEANQAAPPPYRRLQAYAFDPSLDTQLDTAVLNQVTLRVPWEPLERGPVGEYLEVIDHDPAGECFYEPIDLDDHHLLARDGLAPAEGDPKFHQQMVYAVAMTTIRNFERALGRPALWSPRHRKEEGHWVPDEYVQRLRIYPHALRQANAYYSPSKKALLFGYFPASRTAPGSNLPGGLVFTCLSHDVVSHETTHALLDGMHRRLLEDSNPDELAFHEAFADIVALFQHFSFSEVLTHQIARTRGDLGAQNLLGELAVQFGEAIGQYGALRSAIGRRDEQGTWIPLKPNPNDYRTVWEPHARGAILVAAVFDAFLSIYRARVADLWRIAQSGRALSESTALHPDLVNRLAEQAAKSARHVLNMCIRALDYCPPVDLTFGDYLRALITADCDMVRDDDLGYRLAFIEAFRRRGIYPHDVRSLSVASLRWREPDPDQYQLFKLLPADWWNIADPTDALDWQLDSTTDRRKVYNATIGRCRELAKRVADLRRSPLAADRDDQASLLALGQTLGLDLSPGAGAIPVEVHSFRTCRRVGEDGQFMIDFVIELTQFRMEPLDPNDPELGNFPFRGGCTLLIQGGRDLRVRYSITKGINSTERLARTREHRLALRPGSMRSAYFGDRHDENPETAEPFAMLHMYDN